MALTGIRVEGLTKRFGELTAVDDVGFDVPAGALFGLLGPDGAGKSTLLRMLATVTLPDAGEASIGEFSVTTQPDAVAAVLGYMSQQFAMYPDLTVAENLDFFATIRGVGKAERRERAASLLAGMGMSEFTTRPAGKLSGGMKQKLMLASTLMHEPRFLLLDEPTTGVDPRSRREFWEILARLRDEGATIIVSTPYMDEAERCTHVAFLDAGRITQAGTPAEIKALLPGTLWQLDAPDARRVLAEVSGLAGVRSAHLLGASVRVLWAGESPLPDALRGAAIETDAHRIDPDMESVFAHLAEAS